MVNVPKCLKKIAFSVEGETEYTFISWLLKKIAHSKGLNVRTYERGVEAETFSCGTGVTACALIFMKNQNYFSKTISIKTLGGDLSVKSNPEMTDIWLIGPAISVFHGFANF